MPLYVIAITLGAALTFLVQPMLGRYLLPWFGGGATVWSLCLVFFQVMLLLGYAWAHFLVLRLPLKRGVVVHLALVVAALITLPITPEAPADLAAASTQAPIGTLMKVLLFSVGLPYLVVSSTAPLIQAWAARLVRDEVVLTEDPYRLYAWSNAGSLGALFAYPLLVDPVASRLGQTVGWSVAFGGYGLLVALCARLVWQRGRAIEATEAAGDPPRKGDGVLQVGLSMCGSTLLVAATDAVTEDISAAPFLWVIPLGLYLLSFIVCFGRPRWADGRLWHPLTLASILGLWWALHEGASLGFFSQLGLYYGGLFVCCMSLHGALARSAPGPGWLTGFYLRLSLGGALGGLLVGVIAPTFFPARVELHLALVGVATLVGLSLYRQRDQGSEGVKPGRLRWMVMTLVISGIAVGLGREAGVSTAGALWHARSFYGVVSVRETAAEHEVGPARRLLHGRILHGRQFTDHRRQTPTSYYGPRSGLALLFEYFKEAPPRRVAITGLGVGTVAAFGRCEDEIVFFEIDPLVERAARNWFTWLDDSCAKVEVQLGDGRLLMAADEGQPYEIIVLDAFSADAIPTHLLTREAMGIYLDRLAEHGVLAVNISNRHLDLRPVLRAHGEALGMEVLEVTSPSDLKQGFFRARWVLMTRRVDLKPWLLRTGELDKRKVMGLVDWTDDHTPLWPLLRALR